MTEHSALPWRFEPLTGDDDRGMGYIVDDNGNVVDHHGDGAKWKAENLANAELKITAVNSHAALVGALRACRRELSVCNRQLVERGSHQGGSVTKALADADAALKLAGVKS